MDRKSFKSKNVGLLPCLLFFIIIMKAKLASKANNKMYVFSDPVLSNNLLEQTISDNNEAITFRLESICGIFGLTVLARENIFVSAKIVKKGSQTINHEYLLDYYESNINIKGASHGEIQTDIIRWLFSYPQLISKLDLQEDLHFEKSSPQEVYDALLGIIGEWKEFTKQDDNFPLDYVHIAQLEIYFEKYFSQLILEKKVVLS